MSRPTELIAAISRAYALTEVVPSYHPTVTDAMAVVGALLYGPEPVVAEVSAGELQVAGLDRDEVLDQDPKLARDLEAMGITAFRLAPHATAEDIHRFLALLREGSSRGGRELETALTRAGAGVDVAFRGHEFSRSGGRTGSAGPSAAGLARSIGAIFGSPSDAPAGSGAPSAEPSGDAGGTGAAGTGEGTDAGSGPGESSPDESAPSPEGSGPSGDDSGEDSGPSGEEAGPPTEASGPSHFVSGPVVEDAGPSGEAGSSGEDAGPGDPVAPEGAAAGEDVAAPDEALPYRWIRIEEGKAGEPEEEPEAAPPHDQPDASTRGEPGTPEAGSERWTRIEGRGEGEGGLLGADGSLESVGDRLLPGDAFDDIWEDLEPSGFRGAPAVDGAAETEEVGPTGDDLGADFDPDVPARPEAFDSADGSSEEGDGGSEEGDGSSEEGDGSTEEGLAAEIPLDLPDDGSDGELADLVARAADPAGLGAQGVDWGQSQHSPWVDEGAGSDEPVDDGEIHLEELLEAELTPVWEDVPAPGELLEAADLDFPVERTAIVDPSGGSRADDLEGTTDPVPDAVLAPVPPPEDAPEAPTFGEEVFDFGIPADGPEAAPETEADATAVPEIPPKTVPDADAGPVPDAGATADAGAAPTAGPVTDDAPATVPDVDADAAPVTDADAIAVPEIAPATAREPEAAPLSEAASTGEPETVPASPLASAPDTEAAPADEPVPLAGLTTPRDEAVAPDPDVQPAPSHDGATPAQDAPPEPEGIAGAELEALKREVATAVAAVVAGGGDPDPLRATAERLVEAGHPAPVADAVERLLDREAGDAAGALARELATESVLRVLVARLGTAPDEQRKDELLEVMVVLGAAAAGPLAEALASDEQRGARRNYMDALVAAGRSGFERMVALTDDHRWFVVRNAVHMLGEVGGDEAVQHVTASLGHDDARVRREGVMALGRIGGEAAGQLVLGMIADPDAQVRASAARALGVLRVERAVRPLVDALDGEGDSDVQVAILRSLGQIGDPGPVHVIEKKALGSFFSRPPRHVRIAAYQALAEIATPHARALLEQAARDRDPEVRSAVQRLMEAS